MTPAIDRPDASSSAVQEVVGLVPAAGLSDLP